MINESIIGIQNTNEINVPGIAEAYMIDRTDIADMPSVKSVLKSNNAAVSIDDFTLRDGGAILPLSNDSHASSIFKELDKTNAQNTFHQYQLSIVLGNDSLVFRGRPFASYTHRQWIVLAKLATGAWRILGSMARGCDIMIDNETGATDKGQALIKVDFTWESGDRAFYLTDPAFCTFDVAASYRQFAPGIFQTNVEYTVSGFSSTDTGIVQIYRDGTWQELGTYSVAPGITQYDHFIGTLPAGDYLVRILSDTGVASSPVIFTV